MFSFAANFQLGAEFSAWGLKFTNLVIHCICGLMIYLLFLTLIKFKTNSKILASYSAIAIVALWVLSPVNASTVLFAIQRMQQLSTFFLLAALYLYSVLRIKMIDRQRGWFAALFISILACWLLAVFSKENGIIFPILAMVIEANVFRLDDLKKKHKKNLVIGVIVVSIFSSLMLFYFFKNHLDYNMRSFSLLERLMTQSRVLLDYIGNLLVPFKVDISIFADDFLISKSLFNPISTITSVMLIAMMLVASVYLTCRNKGWGAACGIQFYFAGHLLESTVIPLEIYYSYRNYLPSIGVYLTLVAVFVYLMQITNRRRIFVGVFFVGVIFFAVQTKNVSNVWSSDENITINVYSHHPFSYRSVSRYAQYALEYNHPDKGLNAINLLIKNAPGRYHSLYVQKIFIQCSRGIVAENALLALPQAKPLWPLNELSQALSNLQYIAHKNQCLTGAATRRLVAVIDNWGANFNGADTRWNFDYYSNTFLLLVDAERAFDRLQRLYTDGNNSAGHYLLELYAINGREDAAIALFNSLKKEKLMVGVNAYLDYKKQLFNLTR